jgi:hypothetical protein
VSCSSAAGWSSGVLSATKLYHSVSASGPARTREAEPPEDLPDLVDGLRDGMQAAAPRLPRRERQVAQPAPFGHRHLGLPPVERLGEHVLHPVRFLPHLGPLFGRHRAQAAKDLRDASLLPPEIGDTNLLQAVRVFRDRDPFQGFALEGTEGVDQVWLRHRLGG